MSGGIVSKRKLYLVALFVIITLISVPFVFSESSVYISNSDVEECSSSDFHLEIGSYSFFFNFSKKNDMPSLKYLICEYKEGLNGR